MKTLVKRALINVAENIGPAIPGAALRRRFCESMVPHLMDPKVLPMGLVERPARRFGIDILCDPYVTVHRNGYWCGIFFEEELESYLLREVKSGDTVIDVGMNVGHVALPSARLVGSSGLVIAFEPNVDLVAKVDALAKRQGFHQLEIRPVAMGAQAGSFDLKLDPNHTGGATLRPGALEAEFTATIRCETVVGDDELRGRNLPGRVFLKMDVEGFEIQAIEGLKASLRRVDHAVIEVSPHWLLLAGVTRLFELMSDAGFTAHSINGDGSVGRRLQPDMVTAQVNVVFRRA